MTTGMGTTGLDKPQSIALDRATGDFFVANKGDTMVKINYSDLKVDSNWSSGEYTGTGNCKIDNVLELRIHGGKIYVISNDKTEFLDLI